MLVICFLLKELIGHTVCFYLFGIITYIYIEHTVMQQHNLQFTMVTSVGFLFRPSSDHVSFRIKEKPFNRLNVKMGRDFFPLTQI